MNQPTTDPVDEIRAIRARISKQHQHDPRQLVEHYLQLQKQYASRLQIPHENERKKTAQCATD